MTDQDWSEVSLRALHVSVLFDVDDRGRLLRTNEPEPEAPPRLYLVRGPDGVRAWLGADVSPGTAARCGAAVRDLPAWDGREPDPSVFEPVRRALATDRAVTEEWGGPASRSVPGTEPSARGLATERAAPVSRGGMPAGGSARVEPVLVGAASAHVLDRHFPYTRDHLEVRAPVAALLVDGIAVAACYCARRRPTAAEAGAATVDAYRGRGFAARVVAAWRAAVEASGRTALYSTTWDNVASRRLAERLSFHAYADTRSFD